MGTNRELPVLILPDIKAAYAPSYSPPLLIQQTSCSPSLRSVLVLGLCIFYSPNLPFFHIHCVYPFHI